MRSEAWRKSAGIGTLALALATGAVRAAEKPVEAPAGIPAYQPAGTRPVGASERAGTLEALGIPLAPTSRFPQGARAAVFTLAASADPQLVPQLRRYLAGGGRALITAGLAARLGRLPSQFADRVYVLPAPVQGRLTALPQDTVDSARNFLLSPMGLNILAPPRVRFRILGGDRIQVENDNPWVAGIRIAFRLDRWPRATALRSEAGTVPLHVNLAAFQVPPRTRRIFRMAKG
jgi:hypothetical protein